MKLIDMMKHEGKITCSSATKSNRGHTSLLKNLQNVRAEIHNKTSSSYVSLKATLLELNNQPLTSFHLGLLLAALLSSSINSLSSSSIHGSPLAPRKSTLSTLLEGILMNHKQKSERRFFFVIYFPESQFLWIFQNSQSTYT